MAEVTQFPGTRWRSRPWFTNSAEWSNTFQSDAADDLRTRDEMFVPENDVVAHLIFALAKADLGARLSIDRLEMRFDDVLGAEVPWIASDECLRVDAVYPALCMAVVTDQSGSRTRTIRMDAVTDIRPHTLPLGS